jgi:hypothetical protein
MDLSVCVANDTVQHFSRVLRDRSETSMQYVYLALLSGIQFHRLSDFRD